MIASKHADIFLAFLDKVSVHPQMERGLADQDAINILKESINYDLIDSRYVIGGDRLPPNTDNVLFHHAVGTADKMKQMERVWNQVVKN
jgi:hypothetical protein